MITRENSFEATPGTGIDFFPSVNSRSNTFAQTLLDFQRSHRLNLFQGCYQARRANHRCEEREALQELQESFYAAQEIREVPSLQQPSLHLIDHLMIDPRELTSAIISPESTTNLVSDSKIMMLEQTKHLPDQSAGEHVSSLCGPL